MTENLAVDRIYCGDMTDLQPPMRPVIRIYLSSNFTDMVMEKTELVNHIFPIIRNYCKDRHGLDFQVRRQGGTQNLFSHLAYSQTPQPNIPKEITPTLKSFLARLWI